MDFMTTDTAITHGASDQSQLSSTTGYKTNTDPSVSTTRITSNITLER